jgi:hypothetical protein
MKATVLDTVTGVTVVHDGPCSWEWHINNWSCDCNRGNLFDYYDDPEDGICHGGKRFIVIAAEFDIESDRMDYEYTLDELNADYPVELLRKYGIVRDGDGVK